MKRVFRYLSIAFGGILGMSACENARFLDQVPYSQTSPENFYKTESDMKMALVSCYEVINGHKIPGASYVQRGSYGQGLLYVMNAPSDDMVAATSSSDEGLEMNWGNYNESTRCVREAWKVMYTGVNRCNTILHYIDQPSLSDESRTQYIAEARFLRAFFYYHLAWNFGGVPLVEKFDSDGQEPRSSLKDVYDFIFADLDYAYENLAESGILQTSSANKYTAAAYIARICNYLAACKHNNVGADLLAEQPLNDFSFVDESAMWEKSKKVCADIIENSSYVLIDDYSNLFRETTKSEQYKECFLLAEQPLSGSEGYWPNSFYLPTPSNNGTDSPIAYGGRFVPLPHAFYMYHPSDPRRDHNFTGRLTDGKVQIKVDGYTYWNPDPPKSTVKVTETDPETGASVEKNVLHPLYDNPETQTYLPVSGMQLCPGKVRLASTDELQHTWQQHSFSYPLIRLADVYLMYAEALYYSGDESKARAQLDVVLKRAAKGDETLFNELKAFYHRSDFTEELLESRERELIFEFSRKWDLIRYNILFESIAALSPDKVIEKEGEVDDKYLNYDKGGYVKLGLTTLQQNLIGQPHKIWLPISEEQIGVNKNLVQNAGWGAKISTE